MMRLHLGVFLLVLGLLSIPQRGVAKPEPSLHKKGASAHDKQELSPALLSVNKLMHSALRGAVEAERRNLGPFIMFEEGKMKLFRGDKEVIAIPASPPLAYHQLKVIGHATFVAVIQLWRTDLDQQKRRRWLQSFKAGLEDIQRELPSYSIPAELKVSQGLLIQRTSSLVTRAIAGDAIDREAIKAYTREINPHLKAAFAYSARVHIDVLHKRAGELYARLTPEERGQVRGYFYGGRGARIGNLAIQYVSWLIGERTGRESARVIFSEGDYTRAEALNLLAKYGVERELAELVFGDPNALHRDVLIDATKKYLSSFPDASAVFGDTAQ